MVNSVTPSSGNIAVDTTPVSTSVSFSKNPTTYTVTFEESGLPSGTQWIAELNGNQKS